MLLVMVVRGCTASFHSFTLPSLIFHFGLFLLFMVSGVSVREIFTGIWSLPESSSRDVSATWIRLLEHIARSRVDVFPVLLSVYVFRPGVVISAMFCWSVIYEESSLPHWFVVF
ncbi:unnamed protein product, partial [Meganyctiphanes norvegica]